MIRLENISKIFNRNQPGEVAALSGINLEVSAGEFLVVIGANGSGKTTLLNLIAGSDSPTEGTIHIAGENVTKLPDYRRSRYVARVFQNPLMGTASELTILENFRLAALRTKSKTLKQGVTKNFSEFVSHHVSILNMGLEKNLNRQMGSLSGGQRQALTLMMCVVADTRVLLLDEPTAALDPRSAAFIINTAEKIIKENKLTAVFITHNLKDAAQYGDRLIQMAEGRIIRDTSSQKNQLSLQEMVQWFEEPVA